MGIVAQRIDETGIEIRWSDGGVFSITRQQWLDLVAQEGNRQKALQALRTQLQTTLGINVGRGHLGQYTIEWDEQGFPTKLEWEAV
jgi:hypothetical protein